MINGIKGIHEYYIIWAHPKTGELHRLDGPAHITRGFRGYYINDKKHNINGPAEIWSNNDNKEYWINDKCYFSLIFSINQKHKWLLISLKRKLIEGKKY